MKGLALLPASCASTITTAQRDATNSQKDQDQNNNGFFSHLGSDSPPPFMLVPLVNFSK
jgi:hypothetical protein